MGCEASAHDLLERILLDENKDPTMFPIGLLESITNNFSDNWKIGSGGFADVYKGQLRSGTVAVKKLMQKKLKQEKNFKEKIFQELDSLMKVKHKNIVRFLGYYHDTWNHEGENIMAEKQQMFLCFEFLQQGSLQKHIHEASSGLEWRTCYQIIKGICEGLHYLHGKNIVHSDLKPENILLDHNMVPKIADFGLARCFHEGQSEATTKNVVGTLGYMAPEYLKGTITPKSDIYSLGIIITEILTGQKYGDLSFENVSKIWTARFKTSNGGPWLEHVRVCAKIGLDCKYKNRKKRPTTGQIIHRLAELEQKYGHVLDVYPLDIWFPFKQHKLIKCPVTLTNKTDDYIGVWITPTSLDARSNPGYPYVWEKADYIVDHLKSSIFRMLEPHSSETIYMIMRKQKHPPLQAADEGTFDVVMVATKSEKDLKLIDGHWNHGTWRKHKSEDPLTEAKELGTVVHQATLRAAVTSDPARCQEVADHQFKQGKLDDLKVGPRDASTFASKSDHGKVEVWDIHFPDAIATFEGSKSTFYTASHQDFLATICGTNAKIWDLQAKKHVHTLSPGTWHLDFCDLAGHPTLPMLAGIMTRCGWAKSKLNQIVLWDARSYRVMKRIELRTEGAHPKIRFHSSEDMTSLLVATDQEISIIEINVATLLTGHSK